MNFFPGHGQGTPCAVQSTWLIFRLMGSSGVDNMFLNYVPLISNKRKPLIEDKKHLLYSILES